VRNPGSRTPAPPTPSLAEVASRPRLVVLGGAGGLATFALPTAGAVVIGRDPGCAICVDEPSLSRRHARLEVGEVLTITDLGSRHGTTVRGARLAPETPSAIAIDEAVGLGRLTVLVQRRMPVAATRTLWGHGYFELRLAEECVRAQRARAGFALLRVRSPAGDAADRLAAAVREVDIVGCYAPGEWEILAPDLDEAGAATLASALGAAVPGAAVAVACFPGDGADAWSLGAAVAARLGRAPAIAPAPAPRAIGPMAAVLALVERIAVGEISVLVCGETGVGKEVLAEHLHARSRRATRPLVRLNCAALPEQLLESELFGHEKGAFTGATAAKPGLLEQADGGTVLLDEVGELPLALQAKLLRVLEQRELLRVGGLRPRRVDLRFVSATHRDLIADVTAGRFREDLYFRIAGVTIEVPPLRERPDELRTLMPRFIADAARALGRPVPGLAPDAEAALLAYRWLGNLRELRNVLERATLLCDDVITCADLPEDRMGRPLAGAPASALDRVRRQRDDAERAAIADALAQTGGDQGRAAELLGVSRRTLTNKLNRYGFERPRKR
jgi:two-component system response regulator AtoC